MLFAAILPSAASCDKFLDKGPEENLSIQEAFAERAFAERWLSNLYSGLPDEMNFHETYTVATFNPFVGGCDEMEVSAGWAICNLINQSAISSANDWMIWANTAVFARKCNLFLENVYITPIPAGDRDVWIGEVYFLRALFHFMALRMYGPIPIYNTPHDIADDFTIIERRPFEECVEFIISDCEEAIERLPARRDVTSLGRATSVGAYALKARILLYAASDLYNGNSDYANFVNDAGERMFPDYSRDKWVRAAQAAKDCIDYCESSGTYGLYEAGSGDPVDSHYELFYNNWNSEVLFARNVSTKKFFEIYMLATQHSGVCTYGATQQIVDSYRMSNGRLPFSTDSRGQVAYGVTGQPTVNQASGYTETGFAEADSPDGYWDAGVSNMYVEREPRFYAHINFPGSVWKGKVTETWYSGRDGLQVGGGNTSKTGYLIRKFLERSSDVLTDRLSTRTWIMFRLGEVYLNYAEALNEAHDQVAPDVYEYLNRIRTRGGLEEITDNLSASEMRLLIRQERRVELAFETHRFFDTRRWKIAEYTENGNIYGLDISAGTNVNDTDFYQRTLVETRRFVAPRNYLFPIEKSEIEKSPALSQNPGFN